MTAEAQGSLLNDLINVLRRCERYMALFSFLIVSLSNGLALFFHPDKTRMLVTPAFFLLNLLVDRGNATWVCASRRQAAQQSRFYVRLFVTAAAVIVSLKIAFLLAIDQDLIGKSWYFSVSRTAALMVSITFIVFGNYMPKMPSPWNHREEPFDWRGVHHFTGLAFLITGILMFFAWALLPIPEAKRVTIPVVFTMTVMIIARKWYSVLTWKGRRLS